MLNEIMRNTEMTTKEKMGMAITCLMMMICIPMILALQVSQKLRSLSGKMIVIRNSIDMITLCIMVGIISILGVCIVNEVVDTVRLIIKTIAKLHRDLKKEEWLM